MNQPRENWAAVAILEQFDFVRLHFDTQVSGHSPIDLIENVDFSL
jgi:hypothetical protein